MFPVCSWPVAARSLVAAVCAALVLNAATEVAATSPRLTFDVAPMVACRDVTAPEFAAANPDERLVEVQIEISTLLTSGKEEDLVEYTFLITSPSQSLVVADYLPRTTLDSRYASTIAIEKERESERSAGLSISGAWDHLVHISGSGDRKRKENATVRYELHAPLEPVTASGTVQRGRGVYFKIRPARQAALEGSRQFQLTLRAPRHWRGDYVHVHCQAVGMARGVVRSLDEPVHCGRRDFFVALYLAGDSQAKARAAAMVRSEAALIKTLAGNRQHWDAPTPSLRQFLVPPWDTRAARHDARREDARRELERWIFDPGAPTPSAADELEPSLQTTLSSYLDARAALRSLNGIAEDKPAAGLDTINKEAE
jgi:hypothetical protein